MQVCDDYSSLTSTFFSHLCFLFDPTHSGL